MRVYKVKLGYMPDSSGGFGFILMYPIASITAAIIASACLYAAVQLGALSKEDRIEKGDEENEREDKT